MLNRARGKNMHDFHEKEFGISKTNTGLEWEWKKNHAHEMSSRNASIIVLYKIHAARVFMDFYFWLDVGRLKWTPHPIKCCYAFHKIWQNDKWASKYLKTEQKALNRMQAKSSDQPVNSSVYTSACRSIALNLIASTFVSVSQSVGLPKCCVEKKSIPRSYGDDDAEYRILNSFKANKKKSIKSVTLWNKFL